MKRPSEFADPYLIVEHREFISIGCGGCRHHRRNRDNSEFHCVMEQPDYPDMTDKTCKFWRQQGRSSEPYRGGRER